MSSAVRRLRERAVQNRALRDRLDALRSRLLQKVAGLQDCPRGFAFPDSRVASQSPLMSWGDRQLVKAGYRSASRRMKWSMGGSSAGRPSPSRVSAASRSDLG